MPTIAAGSLATVYCPLAGSITVTPGSAGRVSFQARSASGGQSAAPREIYTAETITVAAGDTVMMEAINTDATYTEPAGRDGSLQALVSKAGNAGNRVVLFGDSRCAQNNSVSTNGYYNQTQGHFAWADALAGQRMVMVANMGTGGNTTTDLLARMNADLDPLTFDWLILQCDINDILAGRSAAEVCADYELIYAYAAARGARLIHVGPYAPGPAAPLSAGASQVLLQIRDYIMRVPARLGHVSTIDCMALFGDAAASPPTTPAAYILDPAGAAIHFSGAAAVLIGREMARTFLAAGVPPTPGLVASAADNYGVDATVTNVNLNDFGLMAGNSGTNGTGATNATAWVTATAYAAGRVVINGGNAYLTRAGGTSGATAPTHTGTAKRDEFGEWYWDNVVASDGTVLWEFIGPGAVAGPATGITVQRNAGAGTGYTATCNRADGVGKDLILAVTGAGATDVWQVGLTTSVAARGVAGYTYQVDMAAEVIAASGLNAPMARSTITGAGTDTTSKQSRDLSTSTTLHDALVPDCRLRMKVPAITCSGSTAPSVLNWQFLPYFGAASARACFKVGRVSLRRIA